MQEVMDINLHDEYAKIKDYQAMMGKMQKDVEDDN
jgi:hypothetical protein